MQYRVRSECVECIRMLLTHGSDPNITSIGGYSALNLACRLGYMDIAEMLIEHGGTISYVSSKA